MLISYVLYVYLFLNNTEIDFSYFKATRVS